MKQAVLILFILTTIYFILNTLPVYAQSKILINEFLIDPQPQSVEIFNSGTTSADISDWVIDDSGGTTFYTVPKNNIIFPNQCLIFSSDFNLNKASADTVRLINSSQQLIDSFTYKASSGSGISFFRFPDGTNNWSTGSANLGFYNQTNISCLITPSPTPTITPIPTIVPALGSEDPPPTNAPIEYNNIYLSEVMVNPPIGEKEWVEIYNNNDFFVSINNWYVDDLENTGSSPKIFSLEINAKSYSVFELTSSMFNNDGDNVRLLDFNKYLKDDFEYQKNEKGKTLGRTSFDSDDFCLQEPSKNFANNPCINPTPTAIFSSLTKQINLSPTSNAITPKIQTKIPIVMGRETRPLQYLSPATTSNVLGALSEIIINSPNNKFQVNLLCFISFSYSLLTIISILSKIKLSYGKD